MTKSPYKKISKNGRIPGRPPGGRKGPAQLAFEARAEAALANSAEVNIGDLIDNIPPPFCKGRRPSKTTLDVIRRVSTAHRFKAKHPGSLMEQAGRWLAEQFPISMRGNRYFHSAENLDLVARWLQDPARSKIPNAEHIKSLTRSYQSGERRRTRVSHD